MEKRESAPAKKKKKAGRLTYQYVIIFGVLLAVANILLGTLLILRSTATVRNLIRKNMLDLSNTAAGLIDGDELGSLTLQSVGSPVYNNILEALSVFQQNVDIEYIYAVREESEGNYIFTVDADPEDPAGFGEEVLITNALVKAADGTASVDDAPAQDEWGNFYSSYSPVFDSKGNVSGIIGIDFDSEWYENQIRSNTVLILIISVLFVLAGVVAFFLISRKLQSRYTVLNQEISTLADDVDALTEELISDQGYISSLSELDRPRNVMTDLPGEDDMESLSRKVRAMHDEMKRYLEYAQRRAVTDALTNVSNTTAYAGLQERLDEEIAEGTACFALAVFDVNFLKKTNDRYGHTWGDRIIHDAAKAIASVFGTRNTFRIGGDELLAAAFGKNEEEVTQLLAQVDAAVDAANRSPDTPAPMLSLSKGAAVYEPGRDTCFKDVFVRADQAMYSNKHQYHGKQQEAGRGGGL